MNLAQCIFDGVSGYSAVMNGTKYPLHVFDTAVANRREERPRVQDHGLWPTRTWMGSRTFHLEGDVMGVDSTDYFVNRLQLVQAFTPVPERGYMTVGRLRLVIDGINEEIFSDCDIDGLPVVSEHALAPSYSNFMVDLIAPQPVMFSTSLYSAVTGTPSGGGGGMTFPMTFPFTFSVAAGTTGDTQVNNAGNTSTYPIVTIYGPCSTPSIFIVIGATRYSLGFDNLSLSAGEYVIVDFKARTALDSNGNSIYHLIATGSEWWSIPPGTWTVAYNAGQASSPSRAVFNWNNAYII